MISFLKSLNLLNLLIHDGLIASSNTEPYQEELQTI